MRPAIRLLAFASVLLAASARLAAAESGVAALAFLAGTWRGTSTSGNGVEEIISSGEGGVMLSVGREFARGKCVFYDFMVFTEKAGVLTVSPHPKGKLSPHLYAATQVDTSNKRVVFENAENDFPKKFVYELAGPDRLKITLSGILRGKATEETYDLKRQP